MTIERIILTTGGTGGHIFPALAVAEEIRARNADAHILFMGSKHGPEADLAVQAGLEYVGLPVKGFLGRGLRAVAAAWGMARSLAKASYVLGKVQPQAIIGFGGYAAFAGVMAAGYRKIPRAVHEQNSIPGVANKILSRRVDAVFTSLPDSAGVFPPAKTIVTGNPVRASIAALAEREPRTAGSFGRRVLVMGGSQGAQAINSAVLHCLPKFLDAGVQIWHQTGAADCERVRSAYRSAGADSMRVDAFIYDMAAAYEWADLAVCRAGATSVAELTVAGLPAVFIPFPQATHDHQTHNARQLADRGAAVLLAQKEIVETSGNPAVLASQVNSLLDDAEGLAAMSAASRSLGKPDAAARVVTELERLIAAGADKRLSPDATRV